ncbi:MAG: hypothetical protein LBT09_02230 [Planctomycetaceae bacterium]|jgi:hypothetical protein|nr:hypothetical protein [Planctomycetaceae bacterium]
MLELQQPELQVKSKQRVTDHGEVYTSPREVNAMLDLVKQETERIDSRFLEPACGTGNFLAEILRRKLEVVAKKYCKSRIEFECYTVIAVSSIYGIDILEDNVIQCRKRLLDICTDVLKTTDAEAEFISAQTPQVGQEQGQVLPLQFTIEFILSKNIIWGDALTLQTVSENPQPITFSEWSPINGSMIKRRDFTFDELIYHSDKGKMPLFSDTGEGVFIPEPVKEFPPVHYREIANMEGER